MEGGENQSLSEKIRSIVQGKTEDEAERALVNELGNIPEEWDDPLIRSAYLGQSVGETVVGAHISNFEQAYGGQDRLGTSAKGIGYRRNVEGQGMPGADKWYKQAVKEQKQEK